MLFNYTCFHNKSVILHIKSHTKLTIHLGTTHKVSLYNVSESGLVKIITERRQKTVNKNNNFENILLSIMLRFST